MRRFGIGSAAATLLAAALAVPHIQTTAHAQQGAPGATMAATDQAVVNRYCLSCHNDRALRGGLSLEGAALDDVRNHAEVWERALRKLRAGAMPPDGAPRPDAAAYQSLVTYLETELDTLAAAAPNPGRTDTFRRLNRTEYGNAIRDLLALNVDVASLLPQDDASFGFDNVGAGELSPTLMERYLAAAQKISRLHDYSLLPRSASPSSPFSSSPADDRKTTMTEPQKTSTLNIWCPCKIGAFSV